MKVQKFGAELNLAWNFKICEMNATCSSDPIPWIEVPDVLVYDVCTSIYFFADKFDVLSKTFFTFQSVCEWASGVVEFIHLWSYNKSQDWHLILTLCRLY